MATMESSGSHSDRTPPAFIIRSAEGRRSGAKTPADAHAYEKQRHDVLESMRNNSVLRNDAVLGFDSRWISPQH